MPAQKTLYYGGTFDPPNTGHLQLISYILNKTDLADCVIVGPTRRSPFKSLDMEQGLALGKNVQYADPEHRLKMMQLAIMNSPHKDRKKICVTEAEIKRAEPSYTIETLGYLRKAIGKGRLGILIGDDHLETFYRWQSYLEILRLHPIYVFARHCNAQQNSDRLKKIQKNWSENSGTHGIQDLSRVFCLSNPLCVSSSSNLRKEMYERKGVNGPLAEKFLFENVRNYILQKKLYW